MDAEDLSPYLEGAFLSALMQDWQQTTKFLREKPVAINATGGTLYKEPAKELNPLLGEYPSQSKMTGAGLLAAAAQYAGYEKLPEKYRLPFVLSTLIPEAYVVNRNRQNGSPIDNKALLLGAALTGLLVNNYNKNKASNIQPTMINGRTPGLLFNRQF